MGCIFSNGRSFDITNEVRTVKSSTDSLKCVATPVGKSTEWKQYLLTNRERDRLCNPICSMSVNARIIFSSPFSDIAEFDKNLLFTGIGGVTITNLKRYAIKMLVNVAWEIPNPNIEQNDDGLIYKKFYIREDFFFRIDNLEEIIETINNIIKLNKGPVLIYCMCGMSRSSTIVLAYAMKYLKMSLKEAFNQLQTVRPYSRPNPVFFYQLTEYEKNVLKSSSVEMIWEGLADSDLSRVLNNGKLCSKISSTHNPSIYVLLPNIYRTNYLHLFKSEVIDATQSGDMISTVGTEKIDTYMEILLTGSFANESVHSRATINDFLRSRYIVYSRSEAKPLMLEPLDYNRTIMEIEIARKDLISKRKQNKKLSRSLGMITNSNEKAFNHKIKTNFHI